MPDSDSREFPRGRTPSAVVSRLIILTTVFGISCGFCQSSAVLTRTATFDATTQLPEMYRAKGAVLEDFTVKNDRLYFLFATKPEPRSYTLIRTDLGGRIAGPALELNGGSMHGLAVDDEGKAFVYRSSRSDSSILECDFDSSATYAVPVQTIPFLFLVSGNGLLGFAKDGTLDHVLPASHREPRTFSPLRIDSFRVNGVTAVSLANRRLALISKEDGKLTVIDPAKSTLSEVPLKSDAVASALARIQAMRGASQTVPANSPPDSSGACCNPAIKVAVAYASTADQQGNIYLAIGPFKLTEGAIVEQVREDGVAVRTLRCPLVPHGAPRRMGVAGNKLVFVSHWGIVSIYPL